MEPVSTLAIVLLIATGGDQAGTDRGVIMEDITDIAILTIRLWNTATHHITQTIMADIMVGITMATLMATLMDTIMVTMMGIMMVIMQGEDTMVVVTTVMVDMGLVDIPVVEPIMAQGGNPEEVQNLTMDITASVIPQMPTRLLRMDRNKVV